MQPQRIDRRPFPRCLIVRGDPVSGAFYGWCVRGWTERRRTIDVVLPAPLPTGPLWTARSTAAGICWEVPRQWAKGRQMRIALKPGDFAIATGPRPLDRVPPDHFEIGGAPGCRQLSVVIAGQHPGEGTAIALALEVARVAAVAWPRTAGRLVVIPLVNRSGWDRGFTRETRDGGDPNRSWHDPARLHDFTALRAMLAEASFVLDVHGDEFALRPYLVGPTPASSGIAAEVAGFADVLGARVSTLGARPRAPGAGEDDPGILVNWLAAQGVPGAMLELPMRARHGARSELPSIGRRRKISDLARAIVRTLGARQGHEAQVSPVRCP